MLLAAGFSSMLTDVLIIKIPHVAGRLQEVLALLADVNIEYMYGLSVETTDASIVMKTNELPVACEVLRAEGIATMTSEEMRSL